MSKPGGKRDTIKQQAIRLFAERGVDAVSVRDIAAACDMTAPNLYAHFASKDELVRALFHDGYGEYGAILADAMAGDAPFRVRLDRTMREICRLHDTDTDRFRFLVLTQHATLDTIPHDARNPVEAMCRAVAAAMDMGEIPRREPDLMALAIVGILVQPATGLLYGRLAGGLTERADDLSAMAWRALS
ncbi:MAG: helix-turn-helix domain-containing protein [Rhodospirillales bacterium]